MELPEANYCVYYSFSRNKSLVQKVKRSLERSVKELKSVLEF